MTDDELTDGLIGIFAYDTGAVDSGIHDEMLRQRCMREVADMPLHGGQIWSDRLARIVRDHFLSEEAISHGYGLEDVTKFMEWLADQV